MRQCSWLQAAIAYDQQLVDDKQGDKRSVIGKVDTNVIESMVIKLDTVLFKQQLDNEKGLYPKQEHAFERTSQDINEVKVDQVCKTTSTENENVRTKSNTTNVAVDGDVIDDIAYEQQPEGDATIQIEGRGDYVEDDDDHMGPFKHCADYLMSQNDSQEIGAFVCSAGVLHIPVIKEYDDFTQTEPSASHDDNEVMSLSYIVFVVFPDT